MPRCASLTSWSASDFLLCLVLLVVKAAWLFLAWLFPSQTLVFQLSISWPSWSNAPSDQSTSNDPRRPTLRLFLWLYNSTENHFLLQMGLDTGNLKDKTINAESRCIRKNKCLRHKLFVCKCYGNRGCWKVHKYAHQILLSLVYMS